jgi:Icc-related predicted phosphoesterase
MKVVCVSDTHNYANYVEIPEGDVLVHAGDFTMSGSQKEFEAFARWLATLTHEHVIIVAGNHDWLAEKDPVQARQIIEGARHNIHYLVDQSIILSGIKFYGSPYQPEFRQWAFNLPRGDRSKEKWAEIPDDTNVLITHGPPIMIGDQVHRSDTIVVENVGCKDLAERIATLSQLKAHIYGHIHDGYGHRVINNISYINASALNDKYQIAHKPILLNL